MFNIYNVARVAERLGIHIYLIDHKDDNPDLSNGIHLVMPTEYELAKAINAAEKESLSFIYIHGQEPDFDQEKYDRLEDYQNTIWRIFK